MAQTKSCMYFCENIRYLRKIYGLSQKEMARRLKISVYMLRLIEKGKLSPHLSYKVLYTIEDVFGLSPSAVLETLLSRREGS